MGHDPGWESSTQKTVPHTSSVHGPGHTESHRMTRTFRDRLRERASFVDRARPRVGRGLNGEPQRSKAATHVSSTAAEARVKASPNAVFPAGRPATLAL